MVAEDKASKKASDTFRIQMFHLVFNELNTVSILKHREDRANLVFRQYGYEFEVTYTIKTLNGLYNKILKTYYNHVQDGVGFYYNDFRKIIARCLVDCLVKHDNKFFYNDMLTLEEASFLLLDLDMEVVQLSKKTFEEEVDGATDLLALGNREKMFDISIVKLVDSFFFEIDRSIAEMKDRIKRAVLSGNLSHVKDDTYYIKPDDLYEWTKTKGIITNFNVNNDQNSMSEKFIIIPRSLWAKKAPLEVVADMRASGFPEDAIAYTLYTWCGMQNKTGIDSILRNKDISDSAKRKAVSSLLNMAEGRYRTR